VSGCGCFTFGEGWSEKGLHHPVLHVRGVFNFLTSVLFQPLTEKIVLSTLSILCMGCNGTSF